MEASDVAKMDGEITTWGRTGGRRKSGVRLKTWSHGGMYGVWRV